MFFITTSANQPTGAGYFEVHEDDSEKARKLVFELIGPQWAFMYNSLEDVHPLDRIKLGEMHPAHIEFTKREYSL